MNFGWCSAYSHKTIEIGRDTWRLNPNALLRRGSIEQDAWGWVQLGFESLQGWRIFSSLCGLPHPVSDHPHSVFKTPKKLKWNLLCFIWCSLPLIFSLGTAEKSPAESCSFSLPQPHICMHWWDVHMHTLKSPSDLKAKQYQPFQFLLVQQMFQWDVFYSHCFVFSRL